MVDLPEHWQKYHKFPYSVENKDGIYLILFYDYKRALLARKDLTVICSFESRKARELVLDAVDKGWLTYQDFDVKLVKYSGYPKQATEAFWIEVKL